MAELPPNPFIFADPSQLVHLIGNSTEPLRHSRECELALENYDLKRYIHDLEGQNTKLKESLHRVRAALKDSTNLITEQQKRLNQQMKQLNALHSTKTELESVVSDSKLSNRCLTQGFAKQKANQESLQVVLKNLRKEMADLKSKK